VKQEKGVGGGKMRQQGKLFIALSNSVGKYAKKVSWSKKEGTVAAQKSDRDLLFEPLWNA